MKKEPQPKFMIVYLCSKCNLDSGFTENEKPICRYCEEKTEMTMISKEKLTPEVMAARLKIVTDRMFSNLVSAFESMTEEDMKHMSQDEDGEKEMLLLLDRTKKLKDKIQALELKAH